MRIAITGPTGSIGYDLVQNALDRGDEVIAVVRPDSPRSKDLPQDENLTIVEADISDYGSIQGKYDCDVFYHLAWMETFGSLRDDTDIQVRNIEYSLDAVKLAKSWNASAFIGAGSQAEYGPASSILNDETPIRPESGYGIAKYAAGKMCSLLCQQEKIRFNWIRIVSVFGKRDSERTLIKYLIKSFRENESPVLTPCEQIWDYLYSKDAAEAFYCVGKNGIDGKTYALGSGKPRRMRDYVETVRALMGSQVPIEYSREYYPHQPMLLIADTNEISKDTSFKCNYSFEDAIAEMLEDC